MSLGLAGSSLLASPPTVEDGVAALAAELSEGETKIKRLLDGWVGGWRDGDTRRVGVYVCGAQEAKGLTGPRRPPPPFPSPHHIHTHQR